MSAVFGWLGRGSIAAVLVAVAGAAAAQQPVQFSADLQVWDLDGNTATGKLYAGATPRLRMEFAAYGETRPTIVDPASGNQFTVSPGQRTYMEMPLGESGGPVRIPRLGSVDPADPCAAGELTSCEPLGQETMNGFETRKWQYTNADGERVTAWIATRLRFPVRSTADTGAAIQLRNVVEGAQSAALFQVPAGYARVDDIGGSGNDIADAMAGMDPGMVEQGLAAAKQMHAVNQAHPELPARAAAWQSGPGYVMNYTVTMRAGKQGGGATGSRRSTMSMRYTASIPMNYGTEAVPPSLGPQWSLLATAGSGNPRAEGLPVTMNVEWQEQIDLHVDTGGCTGIEYERSDTSILVKGRASSSAPITQPISRGHAQAMFKIDGLLRSYDLTGAVAASVPAEVVTRTRSVDHCLGDRVTEETKTTAPPVTDLGAPVLDIKAVPLPSTPTGVKGKGTIQVLFGGYRGPAEVEWDIAPIATR